MCCGVMCSMRDLILALRWVQNNARMFGGDANRIVFTGQSAGAMAAGVMLSLPETQGLVSGYVFLSICLFVCLFLFAVSPVLLCLRWNCLLLC